MVDSNGSRKTQGNGLVARGFDVGVSGQRGMFNDIWETPAILRKLLERHMGQDGRVDLPALRKPLAGAHKLAGKTPLEVMKACSSRTYTNKVVVIGSGSSYHAGLACEYLLETIARIPVEVHYASEYRYRAPLLKDGDVVVVVSNSGETTDCIECLRLANSSSASKDGNGILKVAVVNEPNSTLGRECDTCLEVSAGEEVGVAATKAFSATLFTFVLLALALWEDCDAFPKSECADLIEKLKVLPDQVEKLLKREAWPWQESPDHSPKVGQCALWDISCQNVLAQNFIFLGRGFNFPIALEGAMKCKEIAYIHAEGYPAAEMKHGPIALIDQFMPVVFIAPRSDHCYEKIKANIEETKARSGSIIVITDEVGQDLEDICERIIEVPQTHEFLMPLVAVIPLQLIAYMMGVLRGHDVDNPRGLEKTISSPRGGPATSPAGKKAKQ